MLPCARTVDLVIERLPDETLVFDQRTHKAHCLNRTTAFVWRHCDGHTDLAALARRVERELGINGGSEVVQLALEQLASRRLLEGTVERGSPAQRRSRRETLKRLATAAAALPVILTVTAPPASAAASPEPPLVGCFPAGRPGLCPGGHPQLCCSGKCTTSGPFVCA